MGDQPKNWRATTPKNWQGSLSRLIQGTVCCCGLRLAESERAIIPKTDGLPNPPDRAEWIAPEATRRYQHNRTQSADHTAHHQMLHTEHLNNENTFAVQVALEENSARVP